jgi:hypothetical protein
MFAKNPTLLAGAAAFLLAACTDDGAAPTGPAAGARASAAPLGQASASAGGTIVSALGTDVCADVWMAAREPGAPLVAHSCNGGANQRFALHPSGEITAYGGSMCLDVWYAQANDGDAVVIHPCHGGANQKWTYTTAGELRTAVNGKCLDVWEARAVNGARLVVHTCHGGANQRWTVNDGAAPPAAPPPAAPPPAAPPPAAGPAELPRATVDSRQPTPTGRTWTVAAGGDLQGALNAAQPGDQIVIAPGATFVGSFVLPAKANAAGQWITVRSGGTLPAEGTRVGPADAAQMPKLLTPNEEPALATAPGAQGWYVAGVEIGASGARNWTYTFVSLGDGNRTQNALSMVPSRIVLARSYVHGSATFDVRRCVALNSASSAVVDSYLADCHSNQNESQGIAAWNGPGPYKIENNYVEGGHEVLFFGGGTPGISGLIPSDIEVRRNHITRPMRWRGVWGVKNLFEVKSGQRILLEGNVLENNWPDQQVGFAVLLQTVSDENNMPWVQISDVTFRNNVIRNTPMGITLLSRVAYSGGQLPSQPMSRVVIANNAIVLDASLGGPARTIQLLSDLRSVVIERNTAVEVRGNAMNAGLVFDDGGNLGPVVGLRVTDNLFGPAHWSPVMGNSTVGGVTTFARFAPDGVFTGNAVVGGLSAHFQPANYFPATGYDAGLRNVAAGDYSLAAPLPWLPAGVAAPGVNYAALSNAIAGVVR